MQETRFDPWPGKSEPIFGGATEPYLVATKRGNYWAHTIREKPAPQCMILRATTKTQCSQINKYFLKEKERTQSYAESQTLLGGDIKSCVMIKTCTHYADMVSGGEYFTRSILEKWNIIRFNHLEPRPRPCAHQSCRGRRAVAAFPRTWQPHDLCLLRGPWDHNSPSVPTTWLPSLAFCLIHSRLACACSPGPRAKLHLWGVGSRGHRKALSPRPQDVSITSVSSSIPEAEHLARGSRTNISLHPDQSQILPALTNWQRGPQPPEPGV